MKKIILILVMIFTSTALTQSKGETIDWLNNYLDKYYSAEYGEKYTIDTAWGTRVIIEVYSEFSKNKKFYSFEVKDISKISTKRKLRTDKVNENLNIEFYSKVGTIWTNKEEFTNRIVLSLEADNATVERIQKGFIHLLGLLGNKLETEKEFFKD